MDSPLRWARPDRGCTRATYPSGRASAMPVGTRRRSPGCSVTSSRAWRSAPASPGCAYPGTGSSGSSRTMLIGTLRSLTGSDPTCGSNHAGCQALPMPTADGIAPGAAPGATYRERLNVPLRWWVQATMFLATLWLALVVALPGWFAWSASGVLLAAVYGLFAWMGSVEVAVHDGVLHAGKAQIPLAALGTAEALDKEATRRVHGVDADVRAYLVTRPYI